MDTKELWTKVLNDIELNISKPNFNTWFKDTFISKVSDGTIYVGVPNAFVREWLSSKYHPMILKSLRSLEETVRGVEYQVSKNNKKAVPERVESPIKSTGALPLEDHYVNKDNNLNPRYSFESFVVGPFNELAHAASQAVVERPGIVYNPLFVYGNTGHGKTHLIQAIGNQIKGNHESKQVYYLTSEKFSQDYINSVHQGKVSNFKEKYRKYDVLIMDDIQFFAGKDKSQEELFHLFNYLYDNNKQIVFSSDKHPNYINNLEDRLKSRFGAGMIVDIPKPDFESRMAILRTKIGQTNLPLGEEALHFLATNLTGNIREIEGILNTLGCHFELKQKDLSLNDIKSLIKDTAQKPKLKSPQEVIKIVSDYYNIEEKNIYEKTRKKEVIKPRQIIMYLLRKDFNISYPSIGQKMGGRDHTTVIHSCEKINSAVEKDDVLAQEIHQIRSMLV